MESPPSSPLRRSRSLGGGSGSGGDGVVASPTSPEFEGLSSSPPLESGFSPPFARRLAFPSSLSGHNASRVIVPMGIIILTIIATSFNIFPSGSLPGLDPRLFDCGGVPHNGGGGVITTRGEGRAFDVQCGVTELPHGPTYFSVYNPGTKSTVICLHGLSSPGSLVFEGFAEALAAAGHTVLLYDLYGHGRSCSPDSPHDLALFVSQLASLLVKMHFLEGSSSSVLIGKDFGGSIAAEFARLFPHNVRKVVLLAPAGLPSQAHLVTRMMQVSTFFGDVFGTLLSGLAVSNINARSFVNSTSDLALDYGVRLKRQLSEHSGYLRSLLSTARNFPETLIETYESLGLLSSVDVLVIWGTLDRTTPYFPHASQLMDLLPRGELVTFIDKGHNAVIEGPLAFNAVVQDYLSAVPPLNLCADSLRHCVHKVRAVPSVIQEVERRDWSDHREL